MISKKTFVNALTMSFIMNLSVCTSVNAGILSNLLSRSVPESISTLNVNKVLDIDFNNNEIKNSVNNKIYSPVEGRLSLVNSVKGKGVIANSDYLRIPASDLNIPASQEYVTVSFMYKYGGEDDIQMLCAFGNYDIYLAGNMLGFNTGNSGDIYGTYYTPPTDRYVSIIGVFHKTDITKNKLYIDGVKQNISSLHSTPYPLNDIFQKDFYIFNWGHLPNEPMYRADDGSIIDEVKIFKGSVTNAQAEKLAIVHNIPELTVQKEEDYAKAIWATEILETDTIHRFDFEEGQFVPNFSFGANVVGDKTGGQKITTDGSYSGRRSIFLPRTYDKMGNYYLFPETSSSKNIMEYGRLYNIPSGSELSVSFRLKTNGATAIIKPSGSGGWGETIETLPPTVLKDAPSGSKTLIVDSREGLALGNDLTADKTPTPIDMCEIRNIDENSDGTYTVTLSKGLKNAYKAGEKLRTRPWRGVWSFPEIKYSGTEWKLFNVNTSVPNHLDYNVATRGGEFNIQSTVVGNAYLDDIRFGYATKSVLYRDGVKVYEGYGSEFNDTAATDKAAPAMENKFIVNTVYNNDVRKVTIGITPAVDYGTTYSYSILGIGNSGKSTFRSEDNNITITSGIKGYSYVIDNSSSTIPDNNINLDVSEKEINHNIYRSDVKKYYLHIKPIDNNGNSGTTIHYLIDNPELSISTNALNNKADLSWTMNNSNDKVFSVFRKESGYNNFTSISSTDIAKVKKVNVLNVYPGGEGSTTFTTWDNETLTLPASASLKKWMEEPNQHHAKGYGQGIIEVTPVHISNFNDNPNSYLLNSDGSYAYDVIMFGSYDSNGNHDLTAASYSATVDFIDSGRGVLFGHDTVTQWLNREYFPKFAEYLNVVTYSFNTENSWDWWSKPIPEIWNMPWSGGKEIVTEKKGILTKYPWNIGEVGDVLNIPYTHTNSQVAKGDVWLKFINPYSDIDENVPVDTKEYSDNGVGTNMAYLTSVKNVAMIQTGHAINRYDATPDEQKIIANTLFYLNQLSGETSGVDNDAYDRCLPSVPALKKFTLSNENMLFDINSLTDNGTVYDYYIQSTSKDGSETTLSNIVSVDINSGIRGLVYVVDDSATTKPTTQSTFTKDLRITVPANTKMKYLHISSIDNAGNVSEPLHIDLSDYKVNSPTVWITNPTDDELYLDGSMLTVSWKFIDAIYEFPKETIVTVKNTKNNEVLEYVVKNNLEVNLMLEKGEYEISVKSINNSNVESNTDSVLVRIGYFKEIGNVETVDINTAHKVSKVKVVSQNEMPIGPSVVGRIYYTKKTQTLFDHDKYISFNVPDGQSETPVISLPEATSSLRVEYIMLRGNNTSLTPKIDSITVYAR